MPRVTYGDRLRNLLERDLSNYDRGVVESLLSVYEQKKLLSAGRKRYLESLEERYSDEAMAALRENPLLERLASVQDRIQDKSSWDSGFCESLQGQLTRGHNLSPRQLEILATVEERHSEEAIAEAQAWRETYLSNDEWRSKAKIIAGYYDADGLGYFKDLVRAILTDSDFVPTQKAYERLTGNKYAQKVWDAWTSEPKYPVSSYVYLRETAPGSVRGKVGRKPCVVIETNAAVPARAAVGAKIYKVLPFGGISAYFVEERMLKRARKV